MGAGVGGANRGSRRREKQDAAARVADLWRCPGLRVGGFRLGGIREFHADSAPRAFFSAFKLSLIKVSQKVVQTTEFVRT
jgi:hypothetical protein